MINENNGTDGVYKQLPGEPEESKKVYLSHDEAITKVGATGN